MQTLRNLFLVMMMRFRLDCNRMVSLSRRGKRDAQRRNRRILVSSRWPLVARTPPMVCGTKASAGSSSIHFKANAHKITHGAQYRPLEGHE